MYKIDRGGGPKIVLSEITNKSFKKLLQVKLFSCVNIKYAIKNDYNVIFLFHSFMVILCKYNNNEFMKKFTIKVHYKSEKETRKYSWIKFNSQGKILFHEFSVVNRMYILVSPASIWIWPACWLLSSSSLVRTAT